MKSRHLIPLAIALSLPAFATTYYVDGSVTSSGDGLTPQTAVKTVAEGVAKAATAGDVVEVAAGTYTISSQITVAKAITIRGADRATTIIDANSACRIFNVTAAATIESLTLYRGKAGTGQAGAGAHFTARDRKSVV